MPEDLNCLEDTSTAENAATREGLEALVEEARRIGCLQALEKFNHNTIYLTDPRRSRYLDILDIDPKDAVLEIGASKGQHTRLIATRAATVQALEVVEGQAKFAEVWCAEDGHENVTISAGGASGSLSYPDATFDLVILNYVLEWCAGRSDRAAAEFHTGFISEIARVLKPGGRFYLATKNRFALNLLTGGEDEHLGARFGSALPRALGRLFAKRHAAAGNPVGYLHSRAGLEKLLSQAGFAELRPYLAFPDARFPDVLVPFSAAEVQAAAPDPKGLTSKRQRLYLRLPFSIKRNTAASHVYVAVKGRG